MKAFPFIEVVANIWSYTVIEEEVRKLPGLSELTVLLTHLFSACKYLFSYLGEEVDLPNQFFHF